MRTKRKPKRKRCRRWICVDPGIAGTGIAVLLPGPPLVLEHHEVIRSTAGAARSLRCREICDHFSEVIRPLRLDPVYQPVVYMEFPRYLAASGRGYTTAASGDLIDLAFLTGMLARECQIHCILFFEVPISWKGNLKKAVVTKRVKEALGLKSIPNHASDAAGIGLWAAGHRAFR